MKLNIDAHLFCLGTFAERYVPGGYAEELNVDQMLEMMAETEGLDGLFVFYPLAPMPQEPEKLLKKLDGYGLRVSNLAVENWGHMRWKNGSFSTNQKEIRRECIKMSKEGIDLAKELKADSVLLWPAHDGIDYPFQCNYSDAWKYLVETMQEIGEYDQSVKIAIEPKAKDPRQRMFVNGVGKLMMLLNEIGLDNVGGALDVGHSFQAGENIAESLVILDSRNKLFQIHLNDNYRDADPDMYFGSVNFWENLEFFYYLGQTDFSGWCSIDIIAARDDRKKALNVGTKIVYKYKDMAEKLLKHKDEINTNLKGYSFAENLDLIMDVLF